MRDSLSVKLADLRPEAGAAVRAVQAALRVVAARRDAEQVVTKGHLDIATGSDLASQAVIKEVLAHAHPEHAFVGEEAGQHTAPATGSHWLVDPICGTRNFASRLPLYAINVALVENGQVVVSSVGDGAHDQAYVAERGKGAWRVTERSLEPIRASDESATLCIDPGRDGGAVAERAIPVLAAALRARRWELRNLGSSLDLLFLADGRVAGVWHFSRIPPLHFAAGTLLASEAGALVTDERGVPWNPRSDGLMAAASAETLRAMRGLLA